jgi:hypothetical protein
MLTLTKKWIIDKEFNIPPEKYVEYNNSYNIGDLELIKYFVRDYDQQVIGHSSWFDKQVDKKYSLFKKKYKSDNIFKTVCNLIGIKNSKKIVPICWSACFFVKSEQIMRHPKEVYIKLLKFLYNSNDQGGIEGYILERFWYYLFTGESYDTIDECLKELFIDVEPSIKIYCNERKRVWFKDVNKCTNLIENPNTYIIYTKNGEQKILPGVDYVGPDLLDKPCSDLEQANDLTLTDDREFYFYIRGHIRNSFNTDRLKNFVKLLKLHFPNIKFILQTWKNKECKNSNSWRHINEDNTIISKQIMENYFEDENITKQCLIIDERSIVLVGSTNGNIGKGPCPKMGWKSMWYGIYKGLEHLDINSSNNFIVSFRYDYFDIPQSADIDEEKIIQFINNNLDNENIQFIKYNTPGTDNLYMGRYNKINALIEKFHFKLDDILNMNKKIINQEYLVNIIAEKECHRDKVTFWGAAGPRGQ